MTLHKNARLHKNVGSLHKNSLPEWQRETVRLDHLSDLWHSALPSEGRPMQRRVAIYLMAVLLPALGGCATAWNLKDGQQVYGGVRRDAPVIQYLAKGFSAEKPEGGFSTVLAMWALADLPFSAVADTLTLPVTITAAIRHPSPQPPPSPFRPDAFLIGDSQETGGDPAEWERCWFGPQEKPR